MKCPRCKDLKTSVIQSMKETGESRVLRKRKCDVCGHGFQTLELPQVTEVSPAKTSSTPTSDVHKDASQESESPTSTRSKPRKSKNNSAEEKSEE